MYVVPMLSITPNLTALQGCNTPVVVRVDNITYPLLGYPFPLLAPLFNISNLTNTVITPTQTLLTTEAGPMQFNLTFLNPIEVRTGVPMLSSAHTFVTAWRLGQAVNPIANEKASHTCQ